MGGREEERIQVLWFNLTCKDLTSRFSFRVRLQKAPFELMWVILLFFVGAWGEEGGGQDYRDDPAIHPSSNQSPVFPPQTLLIPFWWGVLNKSYFHAFIPHRLLERRSGTQILGLLPPFGTHNGARLRSGPLSPVSLIMPSPQHMPSGPQTHTHTHTVRVTHLHM